MSSIPNQRNSFTFDGVESTQFGLYTNGYSTFDGTTRDVESIAIPGRNGVLLRDNGRFETVPLTYVDCGLVRSGALDRYKQLRAFLSMHQNGFYRLEDTYHPNEYRKARFVGPMEPELGANYDTALFDLVFECQPEHWLKSGETWATNPTSLNNPSLFAAKPLIRITGHGTVGVGSETITVASHSLSYIDYDCALGDAFCGSTNANQYITVTGIPELKGAGVTGITKSSGITKLEIQPRWWTA